MWRPTPSLSESPKCRKKLAARKPDAEFYVMIFERRKPEEINPRLTLRKRFLFPKPMVLQSTINLEIPAHVHVDSQAPKRNVHR